MATSGGKGKKRTKAQKTAFRKNEIAANRRASKTGAPRKGDPSLYKPFK